MGIVGRNGLNALKRDIKTWARLHTCEGEEMRVTAVLGPDCRQESAVLGESDLGGSALWGYEDGKEGGLHFGGKAGTPDVDGWGPS